MQKLFDFFTSSGIILSIPLLLEFCLVTFLDTKTVFILTFIQEVRSEIAKVTWPTRGDTIRLTAIVIGISVAVGLYLGGLDILFTELLKILVS